MKKTLLLLFCLIVINQMIFAQAAISYYPVTSYIGVSTNTEHKIWADLRLQTNTFIGFSNFEISPKLNLKRTEVVKTYIGTGLNFNIAYGLYDAQYINGYFVSAGVMVSPFKQARAFSFVFEVSPYINYSLSDAIIRSTLGITWQFRRKPHTRENK